MEINKNIGQQIKSKLDHDQIKAPEELWDGIEKKLIKKRNKKLAFIFLLFFIAVGSSFFIYTPSISQIFDSKETETIIKIKRDEKPTPLTKESKTLKQEKDNNSFVEIDSKDIQKNKKTNSETITKSALNQDANSKAKQNTPSLINKKRSVNLQQQKETDNSTYRNNTNLKNNKLAFHFISSLRNNMLHSTEQITLLNKISKPKSITISIDQKSIKDELQNKLFLFNEKKKAHIKEKPFKTTISVFGSPVHFSQFGKTSPLDPSLNSSIKRKTIHLNYGVYINFMNTTNWGLRFGILKTRLQNTVSSNYALTNEIPSNIYNLKELLPNAENISNSEIQSEKTNGIFSFSNQLDFIEIPLEISYALSKKKLSPHILGGFSCLYLTENTIYGDSDTIKKFIVGKSDNIFKVNISLNIGGGLNYKINNKLKIQSNLQFKYHPIFYKRGNNYNPYSLGLQTGIMYTF